VDAARLMLADGRAANASVQEITNTADVGFGSFYNHFASKELLFAAAVEQVLDEVGHELDRLSAEEDDPARAFARSVRLALRLGVRRPDSARIMLAHGMRYLDSEVGLAPRALRDINAGMAVGRFTVPDARLGLAGVAGGLLATLHVSLTGPEPLDDVACDEVAESMLRMLGLSPEDAHSLVIETLAAAV
jgi:AcrR family transcriptional regulator